LGAYRNDVRVPEILETVLWFITKESAVPDILESVFRVRLIQKFCGVPEILDTVYSYMQKFLFRNSVGGLPRTNFGQGVREKMSTMTRKRILILA
jgi:hypothetical protein